VTEVRVQPRRRVVEVMSTPALMVPPEATVAAAAEVLDGEGVGAVFVGTPDEVLGVLSERDVVRLAAHGKDLASVLVADAMTTPVVHLEADDTLLDAAVSALDLGVRHLPVFEDGTLTGVVSMRDLVRPLLLEALTTAG
jgi:CBS domain-containing protein